MVTTYTDETVKEINSTVTSNLHPLTRTLLTRRGINKEEEIEKFLNPSYERDIGDPFLIHGMDKAVERIVGAMKNGEKIAVYSDYDCDGIPGGVLLRTFFSDIGYPAEIYIPHRHNEGYGLHNHALVALREKGVSLIITVDLAITNIEEVDYAKTLGIDVIVTDHHLPITKEVAKGKKKEKKQEKKLAQVVPDAVAVINSKQDACTYHDDMLCGCAVAWKVSCALLSTLRKDEGEDTSEEYMKVLATVAGLKDGYEKWLLDLVAISTISDMVPLTRENRALAHFGLKVLRLTKRHGLNHIFLEQGVSKSHVTEDDIAFTLAPRINAASRMGNPLQAHNMLYASERGEAEMYARELEDLNTSRKAEVKDIISTISFDHAVYANDVIVIGDISWGPGVLGLIAQNVIDETGKPTFVWGQGEDKGSVKGSCRSRGDVSVVELMARVQELHPGVITHSGGHEQAGGFSCDSARIDELSDALNDAIDHVVRKKLEDEKFTPDEILTLNDVEYLTFDAVNKLAPFGVGNPKPLFSFMNVTPMEVRWFGKKSEHLEVIYRKEGGRGDVRAIMFFAPKSLEEKAKVPHTLFAHLEKSIFRGKIELRLRIRDIV